MASRSPADETGKARIITHMNRDHARELSHILRHYASLSLSPSSTSPHSACVLTDISLQRGMLIRCPSGTEHRIPFDSPEPPSSWRDVKHHIIAMDATARAALGISDVLLTESPTLRARNWALISGVLLFVGCAITLPYVKPGGAAWVAIDAVFPGGVAMYAWVVRGITWPVLAIHVAEALAFERLRMQRHGVPRWSALWWKWEINVLVQGYGAWKTIDALVDEKRKKQSGTKSK